MFIGARGCSGKKRSPSQGQALCEPLYSLRLACVSLTLSWERLSSLFYRERTEAQRVQVTCPRSEGWSQPNWVGTLIDPSGVDILTSICQADKLRGRAWARTL